MESNTFTRTSFCGKECDNITDNDTKKYILQDMNMKCNVKFSDAYAKLFNPRFSQNLRNPHVVCVKSTGAPYFMYCTKINDIGYTFLIDKKIKEGYDYPKIFVLPYRFNSSIYEGTLLETELIRDKKQHWSLLIGDLYQYCGKSQSKVDIIKRVNIIYSMLNENYTDDAYLDLCPIQVKGYFEYKDIEHLKNVLVPKLSYNVRGYYFVPMNTHHKKILFLKDRKLLTSSVSKPMIKTPEKKEKKEVIVNTDRNVSFQFVKTLKPDIYDLYVKDGDDKVKVGIPNISNMRVSKLVRNAMKKNELECFIECSFKESKWIPEKATDNMDTLIRYTRTITST